MKNSFSKLYQLVVTFVIIVLTMGSGIGSASPASQHPEKPFLSSIPALFLKPINFEPREVPITLYPERTTKLPFADRNRLYFTYKLQKNPTAPLVAVIPGMGGIAFNGTTLYLAELAFDSGYSVITLPSSTHWSFAVAASSSGRTGYLPNDGKDFYKLLYVIKSQIERKHQIKPTKFGLLGYSYGGLDAAFIADVDLSLKLMNFDFVLMINPPLNRSTAINKVDSYYSLGDTWSADYKQSLNGFAMGRSTEIMKGQRSIENYDELLEAFPMEEDVLAWIMAAEFRRAILNSAYAGDLIQGLPTSNAEQAFEGSIAHYIQTVDGINAETDSDLVPLLQRNVLNIKQNKKIVLFHSTNDFLSFPEGYQLLGLLGLETHLYDFGGHMGLISDERVVKDLKDRLTEMSK